MDTIDANAIGIIEIMRMRMLPHVTPDQVTEAAQEANALFKRMVGLRQRILLGPDDEGVWTEICEFEDQESIDAARQLAHEEPAEAGGYFALVDMASMHYERLPMRAVMREAADG